MLKHSTNSLLVRWCQHLLHFASVVGFSILRLFVGINIFSFVFSGKNYNIILVEKFQRSGRKTFTRLIICKSLHAVKVLLKNISESIDPLGFAVEHSSTSAQFLP